jgi:RHS repeat-associated protein
MLKDNEFKGEGNSYATEFRFFDPRVGRWWSLDPKPSASESWYAGMGNNPIRYNDEKGDFKIPPGEKVAEKAAVETVKKTTGTTIGEAIGTAAGKVLGVVFTFFTATYEANAPTNDVSLQFNARPPPVDPSPTPSDNTKVDIGYHKPNADASKNDDDDLKKYYVYEEKTPEIYKHTLDAIGDGQPDVLTYKGKGQSRYTRKSAMNKKPEPKVGFHRDEYPYASTFEGGKGASVREVP